MEEEIKRPPEEHEAEEREILGSTLYKLQNPQLVARFQRFCGIVSTYSMSGEKIVRQGNLKHFNQETSHTRSSDDDQSSSIKSRSHHETVRENEAKRNDLSAASSDSDDVTTSDEMFQGKEYIITNRFLYYLFCFGASLGNGVFYITFFPAWFWNIDGYVGRRIVLIWALSMFIGQAIKDIIRWPRPASPPVVQLEKRYCMEYGMPSTHAMVGFTVPFAVMLFTHSRYEYELIYAFVFATVWCTLVALSRLYMGMHSVLDVIAGLLLAFFLMFFFLPWIDILDDFQLQHPFAPLFTLGLAILLAVNYPELDQWSTSRGDTTNILGICAGIYVGSWLNFQLGYLTGPSMSPPFKIIWPPFHDTGVMLLRMCIGIAIAVATQAIMKAFTYPLLCRICNLDHKDPKSKQRLIVEVPYGFLVYGAIAFNVAFTATRVFVILHIEREMWYTEI